MKTENSKRGIGAPVREKWSAGIYSGGYFQRGKMSADDPTLNVSHRT